LDTLRETIHVLSEEEKREFKIFINRQRVKQNRKDLALFEILKGPIELKPREISSQLYEAANMNAYHTLRKRLNQHLEDFISLKVKTQDDSAHAHVTGILAVCRYLLAKNKADLAAHFLKKAEKLAVPNELYDLLDNILQLQIKHAHELGHEAGDLIARWQENKAHWELEQRINMAYGIIRQRLEKMKLGGKEEDLEEITNESFELLDVDIQEIKRPALMYMIVAMMRSSIISTKNYKRFESYVIDAYEQLQTNGGFAKKDHVYELWFLYMIAHVLYRNRKLDACLNYTMKLREAIDKYGRIHKRKFLPRCTLLEAQVKSYMGQNVNSIEITKGALEDESLNLEIHDKLNMRLNLAIYYFQAGEYRSANQTLLAMQHTDGWIEKKMGTEWRFKFNLIEVIVQIELGNSEIALQRIATIEKRFATFFKRGQYGRAKIFLRFIKYVIKHPEKVRSKEFLLQVNETIVRLPGDEEDIQAMTFYCWLKSKMQGTDYYETLIETIKTFGVEEK
jgi:hypothetical protein